MEADETTAESEEGLMDVGAAFIAHGEAPVAVEPGQRTLHHPAMATQALAGVDALAGDADANVATAQRLAAAGDVVALIGVHLGGTLAPPPMGLLDRRDGSEQCREDDGVVPVSPGQERSERDPAAVAHNMALRARFSRSVGFGPTHSPPF